MSCGNQTRRIHEVYRANHALIWNTDCEDVFKSNIRDTQTGSSESHCYFKCDASTGDLTFIGGGSPSPSMIPNCIVLRSKTSTLMNLRKTLFLIYCHTGLSLEAIKQIILTEQELNTSYMSGKWNQYVRVKLRNIYAQWGWIELMKWAWQYKKILDVKDTLYELVFKNE